MRWLLIALWATALAFQSYSCAQLRASRSAPNIFSHDHNLNRRVHIARHAFAEGSVLLQDVSRLAGRLQLERSFILSRYINTARGQQCLQSCPIQKLGDGRCDAGCQSDACCDDLGDCGSCGTADAYWYGEYDADGGAGGGSDSDGGQGSSGGTASGSNGPPTQAEESPPLLPHAPYPPGKPPPQPTVNPPPSPHIPPTPPQFPPQLVCMPTRAGLLSTQCSGRGPCLAPGICHCYQGFTGPTCESTVGADGASLKLLPTYHSAKVHFVWGLHQTPTRHLLTGAPLSASADPLVQRTLLSETSQELIAQFCERLESAPPWRIRPGSLRCPMLELKRSREGAATSWPVPTANETRHALAELASNPSWEQEMVGLRRDDDEIVVEWLLASVLSNVATDASTNALREAAEWFEAASDAGNADAARVGSRLRGWQTSASWVWMEAVTEVVTGTAGCVISGTILTAAVLLLFTCSPMLACATLLGVLCVLICFVGYLVQREYTLGVVEAIATTIFIGIACDYCVHVCSVASHAQPQRADQMASQADDRANVITEALTRAGPSLYGAALTTVAAAAPLLYCRVLIFQQMGEFIIACTVISLLVALTLVAPVLAVIRRRTDGNGIRLNASSASAALFGPWPVRATRLRHAFRSVTPAASTISSTAVGSSNAMDHVDNAPLPAQCGAHIECTAPHKCGTSAFIL